MSGDEGTPIVVQLYCRFELVVPDPDAVTRHAVARLREADIDWPTESQTLDEAAAEMRTDLLQSLAGLLDPDAAVHDMPGVEIRGGRWWAESGPGSERFEPGFGG
ncbi:hypothetical protein ACIA8K_02720 [Catenuloplanes sp. NPDC051500]|uniref:hypothetical protein n=1 Tax=Catenuloplanes sp. NPDC051500 TaxID=3363959 RepID=UPI00379E8B01